MKKTILTIALLSSLISCKKTEKSSPEPETQTKTTYAIFSGQSSNTTHVYINNVEKQLMTTYEVKVGDVLKYLDYGTDYYVTGSPTLYPIGGGTPIYGSQGYTQQGFTGGKIIVTKDDKPVTVGSYTGNGDTILQYSVK